MTVTIDVFEVWKRPYEFATDDPFEAIRAFYRGEGRPITHAAVYAGASEQGMAAADLQSEHPNLPGQIVAAGLVEDVTDELPGLAAISCGPAPANPHVPTLQMHPLLDSLTVALEPVTEAVPVRVSPQLSLLYAACDHRLVGLVVHNVPRLLRGEQP